jgi:hypothetical protein
MAESWLRSYAIDAPDPVPWGWNPAATFQTAFNDAQAEKRAQEKMALENELAQILLPQKRAEAEFNLKKLAYDTERLTLVNKLQTEDIEERRRLLRSGGSGQGGGGGGNNAPATNAQGFQSQFGFGRGLKPPQAPAKKPSWQVVAPAQPNPTGP